MPQRRILPQANPINKVNDEGYALNYTKQHFIKLIDKKSLNLLNHNILDKILQNYHLLYKH